MPKVATVIPPMPSDQPRGRSAAHRATQSQRSEAQVESQSSGKIDYEHLKIPDALKLLGVDPKTGLSDTEAKKRVEKYGPNALPEKKVSAFEMFGKFFGDRCRG
jgi:magnesium-transporting ATPase (P-type)